MKQRADATRDAVGEKGRGVEKDPYLFIVGAARSGTTLLHRMVDAHPLIAVSPEMHWITNHLEEQNVSTAPSPLNRFARSPITRSSPSSR